MAARTHFVTLSDLQTKFAAKYPFFASQCSYGYTLSQENEFFTSKLRFSANRKVAK